MKKKTIIILTVIALFFAGIAGVVWWQWENIKAIYYSFKYTNEELEIQIRKRNEEVRKYLEAGGYDVRPTEPVEDELYKEGMITDSELSDIIIGETSVEEVFGTQIELDNQKKLVITETGDQLNKEEAERLKQEAEAKKQNESNQNTDVGTSTNASQSEQDEISAEISKQVAQMYVLKANFVARLDGLYNEACAYYNSLTPEQKKADGKSMVVDKFYSSAAAMEAECDAQVSQVLSKITSLLKEQGSDTELVDRIKTAYSQEKSLKKAYYINILKS